MPKHLNVQGGSIETRASTQVSGTYLHRVFAGFLRCTFFERSRLFEDIYMFSESLLRLRSSLARSSIILCRPVYFFEKVPARARLLTWRPGACRVRYGTTNASATKFLFRSSNHNGRLFITSSRDDNAKIYTSKQNGLGGGRSGRISKADIEAPALRAT
jgi:hypothetical protein